MLYTAFIDGNVTGKAKATAISKNIGTCRMAANLFFYQNCDSREDLIDVNKFLCEDSKYIPAWYDLTLQRNATFGAEGETPSAWAVTVDISKDNESSNVLKALKKIGGYSKITSSKFKVFLLSGETQDL